MAKLLLNGATLSKTIARVVGQRAKVNVETHLVACSALMLAVTDGRCNWLNELYAGLPRLDQDAFKAWLLPTSLAFIRGDKVNGKFQPEIMEHNRNRKWLKFESKSTDGKVPRGFFIDTKNKAWKLDAPTEAEINAVADDLSKAFFSISIAQVNKASEAYNVANLIKRFSDAFAALENASKEQKISVSTKLIQQAQELAVAVAREGAIRLATVNGQPVAEGKSEKLADGINPNPQSEQAKAALKRVRAKVQADVKAQDVAATA